MNTMANMLNTAQNAYDELDNPCVCINEELNMCFRKNKFNECNQPAQNVTNAINNS